MKVVFVMRTSAHLRYHKSIIESLIERGHCVVMLYDPRFSEQKNIEKALSFSQTSGCELAPAVVPRGVRYWILKHTRDLLSYRRYLINEAIEHLVPFRQDWKSHLPFLDRVWVKIPGGTQLLKTPWFAAMLGWLERVFPADSRIMRDIKRYNPDVLVASPVNMRNSSAEFDYLKAAKAAGIPTVIQVLSWDNLTVRGLFHIHPDRVLCWNEVQAEEGRTHQYLPPESIRVVGSPAFDAWFDHIKRSATPRDEFCRRYGLRPEDPLITYLGSARNIARDETATVRELREALSASSDERVRRIQIALRVHPGNFRAYLDFSMQGCVAVPPRGSLPDTEEALQLFHDTLAHSIAVVQVNTSGAIDAIIDGTPCISLLYPEFASQQVETIHFKQLMQSGATYLAETPRACVAAIARSIDGGDSQVAERKTFVASFIRPRGMERRAGEWAAREIETLVL